jgi:hypothetical protein
VPALSDGGMVTQAQRMVKRFEGVHRQEAASPSGMLALATACSRRQVDYPGKS